MEQNNGAGAEQGAEETQLETEGQDTVADPVVDAPQEKGLKESVKQEIRKFKLKINGKERDVDEKTLIAMAQKGDAADEKFRKSSAESKKVATLLELAKKDPDRFIKEVLGEEAVEFSKKRLAKELEELSLDPKEKQLRDMKRKLADYEEREKAKVEAAQKEADEKAVKHWNDHYDKVIPEAIRSAGLPLTEDVIRHVTDIMIANLEQGFDLPMQAVMELAKDRYVGSVKKFLSAADQKNIVALLGDDLAAKIGISVKKAPGKPKQAIQNGSDGAPKPPKSQKESMAELEKRLKDWANS